MILTGHYKITKSNNDGHYHQFAWHDIWMQKPGRKTNTSKVHSTLHRVENQSDFLTKGFWLSNGEKFDGTTFDLLLLTQKINWTFGRCCYI